MQGAVSWISNALHPQSWHVMQELFSAQELQEKFSLERITKSPAVFDKTKLSWMNGQYLRALPDEEVNPHEGACHGLWVLHHPDLH